MSAPESYATDEQARAYIDRISRRPRPEGSPRVYLIVYPRLRDDAERWGRLRPALRANLPGALLVGYREVFGKRQRPAEERIAGILASCSAALVVPYASRWPGLPVRYLLGYPARLEAEGLTRAGLPVFVLTPRGLATWVDVLVRPAGDPVPPLHLSQEVVMPDLPDELLPTVAASYGALGLELPARARKAAENQNGGAVDES